MSSNHDERDRSEGLTTHPSDEPTRVHGIVTRFFGDQSGALLAKIGGTSISLELGADAKDDCAVLDVSGPISLVFGSDYVRGPKFALYEQGLLSDYDIGYYLVIANISDIAAMGATPLAITTVVRYPPTMTDADFESLIEGIRDAASACDVMNVGGDIGGAERTILSAAAIGACSRGSAITRSGARAGDVLCLTGAVGIAGAAVAYFGNDRKRVRLSDDLEAELLAAWKRPVARTTEGRILGTHHLATACQDTSDGLKATIEQLAAASGVGFVVDEAAVPVHSSTAAVAQLLELETTALALSASVDFQLAFTVPPEMTDTCAALFAEEGKDLYVIGTATDDDALVLRRSDGTHGPLPGVTWRHQEGDIAKLAAGSPRR